MRIQPRTAQTAEAVAAHYDELDAFYRDTWGEHLHHGYWASGRDSPGRAVLALIDLVAERLDLRSGQRVCDIGCGYGATAQHLAERHGVHVTGVTLSPAQARRAAARTASAGSLLVGRADWLANGFPDACFDRAYAIESSEHMTDRGRFFREAFRTLEPGGKLAVCAWLAADDPAPWEIRHLLEPICREGRLPSLGDEAEYRRLGERAGFAVTRVDDLSRRVRRTWAICARRLLGRLATQPRYIRFLLDRGASNRGFALTVLRMVVAYRTGAMRYCLLTFAKPG